MPRPRTPSRVLELRDSFRAHPERKRQRANEPQPLGEIGPAPVHLSPEETECWDEVIALCPPGVLGSADRLIVEHASRILAALRRDTGYSNTKLQTRFESVLGRLGLTPADRSRVTAAKAERPNVFRGLASKGKRGS